MAVPKRNHAGQVGALIPLSLLHRGRAALACLAVLAALALAAGCRDLDDGKDPQGDPDGRLDGPRPDSGTGYPLPRDGLVDPIGSDATFELAAWNIQLFPKDPSTAALAADLITSMRLDVVVVEEITDEAAWRELTARLPEHESLLSPHVYGGGDYQKLGLLYRRGLVSVGSLRLLFSGDYGPFPRPPIMVPIVVDDKVHARLSLDVIGVHLKAGVTTDDRERRREAIVKLDAYMRNQVDNGGEDEIAVLGDFNEVITDAPSQAVWLPIYGATDRYKVQTAAYAQAGGITYVNYGGRSLDHIVTTAGLEAELAGGGELVVPRLDQTFGGYENLLSDHLPVVLKFPLR